MGTGTHQLFRAENIRFDEEQTNNAIQMAIIDWCKVFGSERDNPFHCGKHEVFTVDEQVCTAMTRFRNKYIAHKTETAVPVPILDDAIKVMFDFEERIRAEFDLDWCPELQNSYEAYELRIEDLLEKYGIVEK